MKLDSRQFEFTANRSQFDVLDKKTGKTGKLPLTVDELHDYQKENVSKLSLFEKIIVIFVPWLFLLWNGISVQFYFRCFFVILVFMIPIVVLGNYIEAGVIMMIFHIIMVLFVRNKGPYLGYKNRSYYILRKAYLAKKPKGILSKGTIKEEVPLKKKGNHSKSKTNYTNGDKNECTGYIHYPDGTTYIGECRKFEKTYRIYANEILRFSNGERREGTFDEHTIKGKGYIIHSNGTIIEGIFDRGVFLGEDSLHAREMISRYNKIKGKSFMEYGQEYIRCSDGTIEKGIFKYGKPIISQTNSTHTNLIYGIEGEI